MPDIEAELLNILRSTVARHNMIVAGQTVVMGVSGGPDSVALLHALTQLRDEWQLSLVACHLNHGFRGEEADADAEYVRTLCHTLNVPCRIENIDVPALQKRRHLSAQQAARDARHAFLRRIASEVGASRIALAHTRDDRTETILLNVLRGSGLEGLAGFPPLALPLIRPLYDVTRQQVEQYCEHFQLAPRHDSSNAKLIYRRNRIRLELLPQLRAAYNLNVEDALLRLANLAGEDNALLETLAADALYNVLCPPASLDSPETLRLSLAKLLALPKALQRRVLRQAVAQVRGDLQNVAFEAIEMVLEGAAGGQRGSLELPADAVGTVRAAWDEHNVVITRITPAAVAVPWQCPVLVPGRTVVRGRSVLIITRICLPDELPDTLAELRGKWLENLPDGQPHGQLMLWLRSAIQTPLIVRSWQTGDRIRPGGLKGSKKIQDIFTDLKIPAGERHSIPLLAEEATGRILAVGKWRVEETALIACRLPALHDRVDTVFEEARGKITRLCETRELFVMLLMYQ